MTTALVGSNGASPKTSRLNVKQLIVEASTKHTLGFEDRYIKTGEELQEVLRALRAAGCHIVLTSGTFDLVHIGHSRYLRQAKSYGDVLIVGVDNNVKARGRKGEHRPIVPETERLEILTDLRSVDLVVLKAEESERWELIKQICPDTLILVEGTYDEATTKELEQFVGRVVTLPRQAETSTSFNVRKMMLGGADEIARQISEQLPQVIREIYEKMKRGGGK